MREDISEANWLSLNVYLQLSKKNMKYPSLDFIIKFTSIKRCLIYVRKRLEERIVLLCMLYVSVGRNNPMTGFTPIIILQKL